MAAVRFHHSPLGVQDAFEQSAEDGGLTSLVTSVLREVGIGGTHGGASDGKISPATEEACSTSEAGEWDEDECPFPIRSIKTRDFFEDTPERSVSVKTLDPFDDSPMHGKPLEPQQTPVPSNPFEPKTGSSIRTGKPASADLRVVPIAKIKVHNTFVDFADDDEDEDEPVGRRRSRTIRTVPARILEGVVLQEEMRDSWAAPPLVSHAASLLTEQQHQQEHPQQQQKQLPLRPVEADAPQATHFGSATAPLGPWTAPPAATVTVAMPEPMYVEQMPSAFQAAPHRPQQMGQTEGKRGPRVSVRNTFLHIDEEAEGAEHTPVAHRRGNRTKTGPAGMFAFDDVSDDSDESDKRTASRADQPSKAPVVEEEEQRDSAVPGQAGQPAAGVSIGMAMPPGMGMPFSVPPGTMPPFLFGFHPWAPFMAQMPVAQPTQPQVPIAQPVQLCQAVAPPGGVPPEAGEAPVAKSMSGSSSRPPVGERTTVVLQNLPLNYRRQMLLRMLDAEGFAGEYDFVYLPMDFKTRAGFGYAFVNLVHASKVARFWGVFEGYSKWMFPSAKVCHVSWSQPLQGLKAHIKRYRSSPLMHESVPDEYRPVLFSGGVRVSFPPPLKEITAPSQKALAAKAPRKGRKQAGA